MMVSSNFLHQWKKDATHFDSSANITHNLWVQIFLSVTRPEQKTSPNEADKCAIQLSWRTWFVVRHTHTHTHNPDMIRSGLVIGTVLSGRALYQAAILFGRCDWQRWCVWQYGGARFAVLFLKQIWSWQLCCQMIELKVGNPARLSDLLEFWNYFKNLGLATLLVWQCINARLSDLLYFWNYFRNLRLATLLVW